MEIITHTRGLLIQAGGSFYLAFSSWMTNFDVVVKILLGISMIALAWHQIGVLRRRRKYVEKLERINDRARERCELAAHGKCWLQDEVDKEEKGPDKI